MAIEFPVIGRREIWRTPGMLDSRSKDYDPLTAWFDRRSADIESVGCFKDQDTGERVDVYKVGQDRHQLLILRTDYVHGREDRRVSVGPELARELNQAGVIELDKGIARLREQAH